jgi:hypothetical protein
VANPCGDDTKRTADAQRFRSPGPDRSADVREARSPPPSFIEQDWLGTRADPDERRRLLRELVLRALV